MSSEGQGTLTVAALRRQRLQRQELARRVLPIAMIAVIVAAVRTKPEPGPHGLHLGIALAVAGLAVTTAGMALTRDHPRPQGVVFALLLASSAALLWLQPGGPGVIGFFLAVAFGARQLTGRRGLVLSFVAGCSIIALVILENAGVYVTHPGLGLPGVIAAVGGPHAGWGTDNALPEETTCCTAPRAPSS